MNKKISLKVLNKEFSLISFFKNVNDFYKTWNTFLLWDWIKNTISGKNSISRKWAINKFNLKQFLNLGLMAVEKKDWAW